MRTITDIVVSLLADKKLDIQELAAATLSGILKVRALPSVHG